MTKPKTLKTLVVFIFLAWTIVGSTEPLNDTDERLSDLIRRDVGEIQTLDSDWTTFHYRSILEKEVPNPLPTQGPKALELIERTIVRFWEIEQRSNPSFYGPGLYLAVDPYKTQQYGKPEFAMFMVKIPKGSRFIQVDAVDLKKDTNEALKNRGCPAFSMGQLLQTEDYKPECRRIVLRALRELRPDFLNYRFGISKIKKCKGRNSSAAILINAEILKNNPSSVKVFFPEIPELDPIRDDRMGIEFIARHEMIDPLPGEFSLWPDLELKINAAEARSWARQNLINCK